MPRKVRIQFSGAVYHLLDRGDRQEAIFRDERDRETFLRTLGEVCGRTGWRGHAWVLLTNHDHVLVETPEANLVAGMRWFQTTYTVRFNRRHRLSGHLFQGIGEAVSSISSAVQSIYPPDPPFRRALLREARGRMKRVSAARE